MKKKYENLELEIHLLASQDVITASVYVKWEEEAWNGNDDGDSWNDYIFG